MTEYTVIIEFDSETGSYGASTPDLPVDGIGKTREEALARCQHGLTGYLLFLHERGEKAPPPRHTATTLRVEELG